MKNRLNLTIDEDLVRQAKLYAARQNISLSRLIEDCLNQIVSPRSGQNILQLLDTLPQAQGGEEKTDSTSYLEERKEKYGF